MASDVRVTFLGGLGEIGRNCAVVEQDGALLIVDCGLMFPNMEMPGVDLVLPDFTYLYERRESVVGCVLTHGHEDHTGALAFVLRELSFPIYGSELTLSFARNRIEEAGLLDRTRFVEVSDLERVSIGPFEVEFIPVTHSVPSSFSLAIRTAQGTIVHTGDFKLDLQPVDGRLTELGRLGEIGAGEGIRLLLSDSTNAEEEGYVESESSVRPALEHLFAINGSKRIIVACFASHIHRLQQVIDVAQINGRALFTLGRSMGKNVQLAIDQGILKVDTDRLFDIERVNDFAPEEVCVLSTGSQGEPMSALSLMASGGSKWIKVSDQDLVIISADVIPGNESLVGKVIDGLYRRGASVVHPGNAHVHASGHGRRGELRTMISVTRPQAFVPVHGEFRHLTHHAELAREMGVPESSVLLAQDGDSVILTDKGIRFGDRIQAGYLYVDGVVGDVNRGVLRDRRTLAEEGVVVVALTVDIGSRKVVSEAEIATKGWRDPGDAELIVELQDEARRAIEAALAQGNTESESLRKELRSAVGRRINRETKRKPMIVPVITEI
jgi:ribonuclease J